MNPHQKWIEANGDRTLRLNYELNENSIVIDAGGYKGDWTSDIVALYNPTVYIFEPVKSCFDIINSRFIDNKNIKPYNFGLSDKDQTAIIHLATDGSSVYGTSFHTETETIFLTDLSKFMDDNSLSKIDLIKINIEGGEFDLLEGIIKSGKIKQITDIQVQFHNNIPQAINKREIIRQSLSKTHYLTYDFEFIWENWRLK